MLLTLGEPRYRLEGDRFMMYEWDVAYGYLVIGGPQAAYPVPVVTPHYLCFEFGADGRLVRRSTLSGAIYGKPDRAIGECMHPLGAPDAADGE